MWNVGDFPGPGGREVWVTVGAAALEEERCRSEGVGSPTAKRGVQSAPAEAGEVTGAGRGAVLGNRGRCQAGPRLGRALVLLLSNAGVTGGSSGVGRLAQRGEWCLPGHGLGDLV